MFDFMYQSRKKASEPHTMVHPSHSTMVPLEFAKKDYQLTFNNKPLSYRALMTILLLISVLIIIYFIKTKENVNHLKVFVDSIATGCILAFAFVWYNLYSEEYNKTPPLTYQIFTYILSTIIMTYLFYYVFNGKLYNI